MVTFRTATAKDIPQLTGLWQQCFGDSSQFCSWFFSERFQPGLSTVAEEDGSLLSAVHGWPFTLRIRGRAVPSIMMCGVSTHPAARGRGLMRNCLSLFSQNARSMGFLALLQKPVDPQIYRWCLHYPSYDAAIVTGCEAEPALSPHIHEAPCSDGLSGRLLPIYRQATEGFSCCTLRSVEDMELKLRDYAADGGRLLMYEAQGQIAAYAAYYLTDTQLYAPEVMGAPAHTLPLMQALAATAGSRSLAIKLPAGHIPQGFTGETRPCGAMAALNVPRLLEELCGRPDIALEVADPVIPQNNGIFAMDGSPASTPQLRLDAGRLMQLLSGYMDIATLAAHGHATLLSPVSSRIAELLPSLPCYTVEEY